MAATNGKTTLVNKLTAIANIIRNKTPNNLDKITLDQMVQEINDEWLIKCYVKEFYIRDDGEHGMDEDGDWKEYFDNDLGATGKTVILSYSTDGEIVLTAQSTDADYSNIEWLLASAPSGVRITNHVFNYSLSPSGDSGIIQSCLLHGINQNCRIYLDCGSKNGNKDNIIVNIYVEWL